MGSVLYMAFLFFAKMLDNALSTAKTILIQRNRCLLAGVCLAVSNYIYLLITKDVVSSDSNLAILWPVATVLDAFGSGSEQQILQERTYVNVIMSDNESYASSELPSRGPHTECDHWPFTLDGKQNNPITALRPRTGRLSTVYRRESAEAQTGYPEGKKGVL